MLLFMSFFSCNPIEENTDDRLTQTGETKEYRLAISDLNLEDKALLETIDFYLVNTDSTLLWSTRYLYQSGDTMSVILPKMFLDQTIDLYVIANSTKPLSNSLTYLLERADDNLSQYNEDIFTKEFSQKKFSGVFSYNKKSIAISELEKHNIELQRSVAKLNVSIKADPKIEQELGGKIMVDSIKLSKLSDRTTLFSESLSRNKEQLIQIPSYNNTQNQHESLFYLFEQKSEQPVLTIYAQLVYHDENNQETSKTALEYDVLVKGEGNGSIIRNNEYDIDVLIKGTNNQEFSISFKVLPWNNVIQEDEY